MKIEAEKWRQEGLISQETWQQLVTRYQLDQRTPEPPIFSAILYATGGILIGLAVITFVAANWQNLDRITKLILLIALLVVTNTLGFYLWQHTSSLRRLGQGILLTAGLVLGAVIALVAQTFNLSGPWYGLFFAWSLGVLVMGISLRWQPLGMMGFVLLLLGYIGYLTMRDASSEVNLLAEGMPYFAILFVPLAYWFNSRAIFVVITLLWLLSVGKALAGPLALPLPAIILWGYGESWQLDRLANRLFPTAGTLQPVARAMSVVLLSLGLFIYSFQFSWDGLSREVSRNKYVGPLLLILATYVILHQLLTRREARTVGFLSMAVLFTGVSLGGLGTEHGRWYVLVVNLLLLVYSLALMRVGINQLRRGVFWLGMVLLSLQIVSRMFEYNTGLLWKAIGLGLCGLALIGAGVGFERRLAARESN
ncbi:MAG: DUF2157 domain-containing protein [Gloeomargarita sp. SKYG116]|nr:DUF2157 domain-containing protein [Gloeomargarita sp. SKYG116]MCS7226493.1 DUF2157 domain-containing protein [Gloeomargarita sp. SKYB31]MDW8400422.1 DUF2157 domain-containing protein [Gloeomargarita sp. SKYGB_i_bin116]